MTKPWIKVWSLNGKNSLKFDREGSLYYLTASPCQKDKDEEDNNVSAMQVIQKGSTVDINDAHMLLGHIGKTLLEMSSKLIGLTLTGTLTTCDVCAKAKAKAKGVTKKVAEPASKPGERLYFDILGPYSTSLGLSLIHI